MHLSIDTETTGLYLHHGCRPFLVIAGDSEGTLFYWQFRVNPKTRNIIYDRKTLNEIYEVFSSYDNWVFHNSLFDLTALSYMDSRYTIDYFEKKNIDDTMLMAHCIDSGSTKALKPLGLLHLDYPEDDEADLHKAIQKSRRLAKKLKWAIAEASHPHLRGVTDGNKKYCDYWLPYELATRRPDLLKPSEIEKYKNYCLTYGLGDIRRTRDLYTLFRNTLEHRKQLDQYQKNKDVIIPTLSIQNEGLDLKVKKLPKVKLLLEEERESLRQQLIDTVSPDFNPQSGQQLAKYLYDDRKLPVAVFTDSGNPSTDKNAIEALLDSPIPQEDEEFLRTYQKYQKYKSGITAVGTYEKFLINNKLYGWLRICGTSTLRWSCDSPNIQNISKKEDEDYHVNLREIFGPPPGYIWVCVDYSQLQLRIFASACKDPFLLKEFERGADIHDAVARRVFSTENPTSLQRRQAKAINFGIIFGASDNRIDRETKLPGLAKEFKKTFPLVNEYIAKTSKLIRKQGYVETLGGYPLRVAKKQAYRGCNYIVQGTEGEMVKDAVHNTYLAAKNSPFSLKMIVHDEIIFTSRSRMSLQEYKDNEYYIDNFRRIMEASGTKLGIHTPTDSKITTTHWKRAN